MRDEDRWTVGVNISQSEEKDKDSAMTWPLGNWFVKSFTALLFLICISYGINHFNRNEFVDNFIASLFATLLGLMLGIPVALEINRRQQVATARQEKNRQEEQEKERSKKVLTLVKSELLDGIERLTSRQRELEKAGSNPVSNQSFLKDELWRAFADGGELQWIKDLNLLNSISSAYYNIGIVKFLDQMYFQATHFTNERSQFHHQHPYQYVLEYLRIQIPRTQSAIEKAIQEISTRLI